MDKWTDDRQEQTVRETGGWMNAEVRQRDRQAGTDKQGTERWKHREMDRQTDTVLD